MTGAVEIADEIAEQRQLRETVRAVLMECSPEGSVRELMETEDGFDPSTWSTLTDLGLVGLLVPDDIGGSGGTLQDLGVVLEEAGGALLCAPFFSSAVLATQALALCADRAVSHPYLRAMASGRLRATVAIGPGARASMVDDVPVAADRHGSDWCLTGTQPFVVDGHSADLILVAGRTPDGLGLFSVRAGTEGASTTPLSTFDMTRKVARVRLDRAAAERVDDPAVDLGGKLTLLRAVAVAALAAEQAGAARRALELTVEYVKTRQQFGFPIGANQAIKHICADMYVDVHAMLSASRAALGIASATPIGASSEVQDAFVAAAWTAGAHCSEAFVRVASAMIQVLGGIGCTWEHIAHLYYRRAKSSALLLGTAGEHRERLVKALLAA